MRRSLALVLALGAGAVVPVLTARADWMPVQQPAARVLDVTPAVLETFLDRPFLPVIRAFGRPAALRSTKDGQPGSMVWIYRRPKGVQVEFLIGEDGKVKNASLIKRLRENPEF